MDYTSINDEEFMKSEAYKNFMEENKGEGYLNIRAYAASEAIPISNMKVVVSSLIDNKRVIFFQGNTDNSGIISRIVLPAPISSKDNLIIPLSTTYRITATYNGTELNYDVKIYNNIWVTQSIVIVPEILSRKGNYYGS